MTRAFWSRRALSSHTTHWLSAHFFVVASLLTPDARQEPDTRPISVFRSHTSILLLVDGLINIGLRQRKLTDAPMCSRTAEQNLMNFKNPIGSNRTITKSITKTTNPTESFKQGYNPPTPPNPIPDVRDTSFIGVVTEINRRLSEFDRCLSEFYRSYIGV